MCCGVLLVFFFKQKTAYDMRISDWSSDVCSSDLSGGAVRAVHGQSHQPGRGGPRVGAEPAVQPAGEDVSGEPPHGRAAHHHFPLRSREDRKSVVSGKRVSVRVAIGGQRYLKKKITTNIKLLITVTPQS